MKKSKLRGLITLLLLLITAMGAIAGEIPQGRQLKGQYKGLLPEYYPNQFDRTGVLQQINKRNRHLLINSKRYPLDPNVRIHTLRTQYGSTHSLRENMEIAYKLRTVHYGKDIISEIWELPSGSVQLH